MEIVFANHKLQVLCESRSGLQQQHGQSCARKVTGRLQDLEACTVLEEMRTLPGRCHELSGNRAGQLSIELSDGKRLIVEPDGDPPPAKPDGGLDWTKVRAVRVVEIHNYHRG